MGEIIMRTIFRHIAKRIYKKKYNLLLDRLLAEYEFVKYDNTKSFNTISKVLISGEDRRFLLPSAKPGLNRLAQIQARKEYLIKLYKKHSARKFFKIYY
jgi:hypothetical protein